MRLESLGCIKRVNSRPHIVNPCSVVFSKKWRCVLDASLLLNPFCLKRKTRLADLSATRLSGRYAARILGPADSWLILLKFVSPLPFFGFPHNHHYSSSFFVVVVFAVIMRACRNIFIPHYHADVILYPVNMC